MINTIKIKGKDTQVGIDILLIHVFFNKHNVYKYTEAMVKLVKFALLSVLR